MTYPQLCALLVIAVLAACDKPAARSAERPHVPALNPPPDEASCVPRDQAAVVLNTTRLREADLDNPMENPLIVADAAVDVAGNIIALDASEFQVKTLDPSARQIRAWGKRGGGPGEFLQPVVIAVGPGSQIYVFERRGRAQVFSATGELVRTFRFPFDNVADAAILPNGEVIVVADVDVRAPLSSPYVLRLDTAGKELSQLLVADRSAMNRRPLLAALFNKVRVTISASGDVAVWYVYDRYADVFTSDGRHVTIAGCMDPAMERWYRAQRNDNAQGATSVIAVSGVAFDGKDLVMVGPGGKDRMSEIQIARYSGPEYASVANYKAATPRGGRPTFNMSFTNGNSFITYGPPFPSLITKWTMRR